MYGFEPSDEQKMLMQAVSRFARNELQPAARQADESGQLVQPLIDKGWDLGVLQASIPEAHGGFGQRSAVTGVLAIEELSRGDLSAAFAIGTPGLFALPILLAGSDAQQSAYLPKIAGAGWQPFTAGLIEYDIDFDPEALRTLAARQAGNYVLNGEKCFVPFAPEAHAILIYANLEGQTQGFIVPAHAKGLAISGERDRLLGINGLPLHSLRLESVEVAAADRLGGASGHDFGPILASMRVAQAAAALGVARAAFEYSLDYAKQRDAFGMKIAQKQAVAFMLAEMRTELEAIRLLTWEAAWKLDTGGSDAFMDAYLAQVGAMDMAMSVTDRAVQILGGHGYIRDHPVEMWMRNGRGFSTFTGFAMV